MANPCKYYIGKKEYTEDEFKKYLAEGGLDKFIEEGFDISKINIGKEAAPVSGIKNVISQQTRTQLGLPSLTIPKFGEKTTSLLEGKRLVDSGEINPEQLVDRILNTPDKGTNSREADVMQYYTRQLNTARTEVINALANENLTPSDRLDLLGKLGQYGDRLDEVTEANILAGGDWSKVGNKRQEVYDEGYNPVQDKAAVKEIYGGKIPDEIKIEIDKAFKERDEALVELAKREEIIRIRVRANIEVQFQGFFKMIYFFQLAITNIK
jgi:hypothetical protein